MAEIIENGTSSLVVKTGDTIPSNGKANAGLTLGIIGTALSGVMALGGIGSLAGLFSGSKTTSTDSDEHVFTEEEVYLERQMNANQLAAVTQRYEDKISNTSKLTDAFFDAYQRDIDNSFNLYKYSRDNKDELNQKITDASFQLYKYSHDGQDALGAKIAEVDKKVDMMAAIRPYQDALIDSKINQNALIANFNLARRTCKMIEGQVVLPSSPTVTGLGSYQNWPYAYTSSSSTTDAAS